MLGVTKDSVLRLDENTKEILKTWPLTTVRRWVAAPRVFTLDFGDYQDQYYSVQTNEGEQISQLIAGYIDIILKRRQKKDRIPEDGNDNEVMEEDIVMPQHATTIQNIPGSTGKKPTQTNVAKPGVLRNSGGECVLPVFLTPTRNLLHLSNFIPFFFEFFVLFKKIYNLYHQILKSRFVQECYIIN